MTAKKAPGASERRSAQAVELFEKAMKTLGKRDYEKTQEHLEALLAAHVDELDVAERARLYLGLCQQKLEKKSAFKPKTFDEHLNYGVLLHNRGEFKEALKLLGQAAEIQPRNEHVLYCLAASSAQAGDAPAALKSLRAAIEASPTSRAQARADSDFDPLRDNEEFLEILDGDLLQ
jgi:tetratricopeptide (TPR) repeat protein